jgi:CheY-like chemotaxis protein
VASTPTIGCILSFALVDLTAVGALRDLLIHYFGTTNFLLILLVFAFFWIRHLRNGLTERDDREKSFEGALALSKMRADALEERLRLSGDRSQLVEERGKIIEQRNLLGDERLAAGEELLRLINEMRSIVRFRVPPTTDVLSREILLVEDEKALHFFREGIEAEFPGLRVRLANNGAEALAAMLTWRPDLLITDLVMPVLDGYELVRRVARQYPDIPVLVVSAYADHINHVAATIGLLPSKFEFQPKPLRLQTLLDAIERLMPDHREERKAKSVAT